MAGWLDTAGHRIGSFVRSHQEHFLPERGGEMGISLTLSPKVKAQSRGRVSPGRFVRGCTKLQVRSMEIGVSCKIKMGQVSPSRPSGFNSQAVTLNLPTCSVWLQVFKGQGRQSVEKALLG